MRIIKRVFLAFFCLSFVIITALLASCNLHVLLLNHSMSESFVVNPFTAITIILSSSSSIQLFIIIAALLFLILGILLYSVSLKNFDYKTRTIIPGISTPIVAGHGEHGTARFSSTKEIKCNFGRQTISTSNPIIKKLINYGDSDLRFGDACPDFVFDKPILKSSGIIVNKSKYFNTYYYVDTDTHSIVIGATRCGKTRTISIQTICLQALAGESMITVDPKGEMYLYLCCFLKRLGYEVITIDYDNANKSTRYNPLQEIIDFINADNVAKAVEAARDLVTTLVADTSRGEPVWTNGERSVLSCAIISVVWDNKERPEYQNMANVYYFIAKMCKPFPNDQTPLFLYLQTLVNTFHPATLTIDIAEISPSKMRGSFYGSALTTLSLFVDPNIYGMTNATDFNIYTTGNKKRAVFIILPDEKETYYSQATLFVSQEYQRLKRGSKKNGNRLPLRVHFNLEELGNFTKINNIKSMLTVGGGTGIIFNLYLQSFAQLDDIYGKDVAQIIRDNCETLIYLQTNNDNTLQEISRSLGTYTIKAPSVSSSEQGSSSSYSLASRNLLSPDEIRQIVRPWQLVTRKEIKAICYVPDISKTVFNKMLGLGSKKHNIMLITKRQEMRTERKINLEDMKILTLEDYFPTLDLEEKVHKTERPSNMQPRSFVQTL